MTTCSILCTLRATSLLLLSVDGVPRGSPNFSQTWIFHPNGRSRRRAEIPTARLPVGVCTGLSAEKMARRLSMLWFISVAVAMDVTSVGEALKAALRRLCVANATRRLWNGCW